jgi:DNA polymerase-3 subunit delta'
MQFKDVVGQNTIKKNLIQGISSGRISHAQLFCGSEGMGALSLAVAYAQYLNCENPGDDDSCGVCNNCNKYQKLIHPDLHFSYPTIGAKELSTNFIEEWRKAFFENPYMNAVQWIQRIGAENKQGNITADETHEIIRKLSLKMFEGPYKVLIMWLPEFLGKEGNILLKLIEEPTDNTILLFITEDRDKILSTIQSRTQIVQLTTLSEDEIYEGLISRYNLAPEQATTIAKISDGNFNIAIGLMDEVENNFHEIFRDWMLACVKNQMGAVMGKIEEMNSLGRVQLKNLLSYGLYVMRACMLYNNGVYERLIANTSDKEFISKFSRYINQKNIYGFAQEFNDAIYHIERNANPKITLLNLSLQVEKLFKVQNA